MTEGDPRVWVVDDEPDVLDAVTLLLNSADLSAVPCTSGADLLASIKPDASGCILLDLRMPVVNGLEVQRELLRRGFRQPVIFLSGHGDIPIAVRAIQAGALDFLEKPVREKQLLAAVSRALKVDHLRRFKDRFRKDAQTLLDSLSPREAEVARLLQHGLRTAQIAERLELSPRTVEMHRARLLRRIGARTTAEAIRIIGQARELVEQG